MRTKICRKEAKESRYWLKLLEPNNDNLKKERESLIQEVTELMKNFRFNNREIKIIFWI